MCIRDRADAKKADDFSSLLIATKQLYASHYIDASLALSSLVRIGADDKAGDVAAFVAEDMRAALVAADRKRVSGGDAQGSRHAGPHQAGRRPGRVALLQL